MINNYIYHQINQINFQLLIISTTMKHTQGHNNQSIHYLIQIHRIYKLLKQNSLLMDSLFHHLLQSNQCIQKKELLISLYYKYISIFLLKRSRLFYLKQHLQFLTQEGHQSILIVFHYVMLQYLLVLTSFIVIRVNYIINP